MINKLITRNFTSVKIGDSILNDGGKVLKMIANEYDNISKKPVFPQINPGYLRKVIPSIPPQAPETFDTILEETKKHIIPNMTNWQHPNFFAYFLSNVHYSSIMAEMISTAFNTVGFTWFSSPSCTELENIMMDWCVDALNLPKKFRFDQTGGGCIYTTIGEIIMLTVHSAKFAKKIELNISNKDPLNMKFVGYYSGLCHISSKKALMLKDIPYIREIPVQFNLETYSYESSPEMFEEMLKKDIKNGLIPFWVGTTIGGTSTGGADNLVKMGEICREYKLFMNVDAAWAGSAFICPEYQAPFKNGLEYADALQINFGKWMMTGIGCSLGWVADRKNFTQGISGQKEELKSVYLENSYSEADDVIDYKDWNISLSKKFTALKIWYVFRSLGVKGIQDEIRKAVNLAIYFEKMILNEPRLEIPFQRNLNLICVRIIKDKNGITYTEEEQGKINRLFLTELNKEGKFHLSGASMRNIFYIRVVIGNLTTNEENVKELFAHMQSTLNSLDRGW